MSTLITKGKNRAILALSAIAAPAMVATVTADAATMTAGSFDLTKQATPQTSTFPVMFDRPSGVNAAALAGTIRNLGSDSEIYASAVSAIPELADSHKMQSLLANALGSDAAASAEARGTILKLINWYNSQPGIKTPIQTQSGAAYTASNLDEPINVLAVAFSNDGAINARVDDTLKAINSASTVQDIMNIFDSYKAGASNSYKSAFDAFAAKVYAPNADLTALSSLESLSPVLDAYEAMYATGAAAVRQRLLDGQTTTKEAGVTFFESAVIVGRNAVLEGGGTDSNTPTERTLRTRWVDDKGNVLKSDVVGKTYAAQGTIDGHTFKERIPGDGVLTYVFTKNTTPETPKPTPKEETRWVDESGKTLRETESGTKPDDDGVSDIPGHTLVSHKTTKDSDGNAQTVNVYRKTPESVKADTYWFDNEGNTLKDKAVGQTLPDIDGQTDVPGYRVLRVITVSEEDKKGDFKDSTFKVGDTINIYEKVPEKTTTTKWVDKSGKTLKDPVTGSHPDKEGDDVPGHTLVSVVTDEGGNVTNIYEKTPEKTTVTTKWVDKSGTNLKDPAEGSFPDNDGNSDVPGWRLSHTTTDTNGNVTNVYEKIPTTKWVDKDGNSLKDPVEGTHPDKEGDDVPGYKLIEVKTDTETGDVTNIYEKRPEPTTKWVDREGTSLKDPVTGAHPDKEGDDVPGYKLVDVKTDGETGDVVNVYEKLPITKWVDESGKSLKDPTEGAFPDKEGDDIPGHILVGTTIDEKTGDVTNVYKLAPATVTTHWVTRDGKNMPGTEPVVAEGFKEARSFDGYKIVDIKLSQDGKEKFYVYEPVTVEKKTTATTPAKATSTTAPAPAQTAAAKTLPATGDASMLLAQAAGAGALTGVGAVLRRRKRK